MSSRNTSKRSAAVVGIAVMGSRLMGLAREVVFAFMFGASGFADTFVAAFRIPNLLRDLFAEGALSTAFTTTFTKLWTKEGAEASWRLARLVLSALILILGAICLLGIWQAPAVVSFMCPGFSAIPGKRELTIQLTQILFPFILFVSIAAAVMGMLNSRNIFGIPASASTVFNIVSIIAGIGLALVFDPQANWHHPHFGKEALYGWSLGVLIGGVAQLAIQLPSLWKLGFRFAWKIDFSDPALRMVLLLMIPSAIAGSAVQINVFFNSLFASLGGNGPVSWLYYAFRLVQLPIGIFGVAIATVTLPAVARQHALDDLKAFGKTVEDALRFGFYLTLPASVGLAVVAEPVIRLIYEHGQFTPKATAETALALQAYAISIAGYSGIKILVPCFYAMQPTQMETSARGRFGDFLHNVILFTPCRVSLIGIALNLALCCVLYLGFHLGHVGLALATGLVALINFLQLLYAIQKRIDVGQASDWFFFFVRVTIATLACGATAWAGDHFVLARLTHHFLLGALVLLINIADAGVIYFLITTLLGVPESTELVDFAKRKLGRR